MSAKVLAVTLALMRFSMALAAFRRNGRAAVLLHAGSLALYLASVLLYEVAFSMILAAGIGYIAFFGGRALRRWVIDIACIGAVLAFVTSGTFYDPLPIADMPEHARKVWRDAAFLLADSLWPPAHPSGVLATIICALIAGVMGLAAWRIRRSARAESNGADHLRPWLAVAIESLVAAVASYGAIIPSPTLYPLATADRIGPTCLPPSILTVQPVLPKGATVFLSGKGSGRRPGGSRRGQ